MGEKSKWFDRRPTPISILPTPAARVTVGQLTQLVRELVQRKAPADVVKLFESRAQLRPDRRCLVNLQVLLKLVGEQRVHGVLEGGLTETEKFALIELQVRGYSQLAVAAAHGLLNVAERETALRMLRDLLSDTRVRDDASLTTEQIAALDPDAATGRDKRRSQ